VLLVLAHLSPAAPLPHPLSRATPVPFAEPEPDDGPVLVTVAYAIEAVRAAEFLRAAQEMGRIRRCDGAFRWAVFYDAEAAGRCLETFMVRSWSEHLRQHARFMAADRAGPERVRACGARGRALHRRPGRRGPGREGRGGLRGGGRRLREFRRL
jgi:hypothetical protein